MAEPLQIVIGATPNPNAVKLTLNRIITSQGETYRGDPASVSAPWAKALLTIPGVLGVYAINNFISMNKAPEAEWDAIVPQAEAGLRRVFE